MNTKLLIDLIVRQTTVLIAQLSTAAGIRAPLADIADQLFVQLSQALEAQGVPRKVVADMFGLALRGYQKKVQRITESATEHNKTLWQAMLDHLHEQGSTSRIKLFARFGHDDPASVGAVLADLVNSGLVYKTGAGDATLYGVTHERDYAALVQQQDLESTASLVWLTVYRNSGVTRARIMEILNLGPEALDSGLTSLLQQGRIEQRDETYSASTLMIPVGSGQGWESAVFDHFQAMVTAIGMKLSMGQTRSDQGDMWSCPAGQQGATCAGTLIGSLGERLHRAPLPAAEQARYLQVFNAQPASDSFDARMATVLEAILASPFFLYRLELPPAAVAGPRQLPSLELASRLSFLLWNSAPDTALLGKAKSDQLASKEQLRAEAERLLADPRAERGIAHFERQWLGIADLPNRPKDAEMFPEFSAEGAQRMQQDAERFAVDVVLKGDGTLASLLQAPFTAAIDGTARAGLLTQPAFLAAHASADQSSIVLRGNFVRAFMLCDAPPPPPANADAQAPDPDPNSTLRERFAVHESDPTCGGCHKLMDPIGFGLESYDAIGRYRAMEAGRPVDVSGEITDTEDADGKFMGPTELGQRLAGSEQVRSCVARQWFDYAFGRDVGDADACAFQGAYDTYKASGADLRALLLAFVTSDAFRLKAEAAP